MNPIVLALVVFLLATSLIAMIVSFFRFSKEVAEVTAALATLSFVLDLAAFCILEERANPGLIEKSLINLAICFGPFIAWFLLTWHKVPHVREILEIRRN